MIFCSLRLMKPCESALSQKGRHIISKTVRGLRTWHCMMMAYTYEKCERGRSKEEETSLSISEEQKRWIVETFKSYYGCDQVNLSNYEHLDFQIGDQKIEADLEYTILQLQHQSGFSLVIIAHRCQLSEHERFFKLLGSISKKIYIFSILIVILTFSELKKIIDILQ